MMTQRNQQNDTKEKPLAPHPSLAAFVVGNSPMLVPKPWPRANFQEALLDTLLYFKDPWIIFEESPIAETRVTKNGTVTEMTLEAIENYTTIFKDADPQEKAYPDTFLLIGIKQDTKTLNDVSDKRLPKEYDNVFEKKKPYYGSLVDFQKALSEKKTSPLKLTNHVFELKIPTILIVVEGGLNTVEHVAKAVKAQLPVLLIRGSGKAADLIGACLRDEHALATEAPLLFGITFSKENFISLEENINIIKQNRSMVSEFDILTEKATTMKEKVSEGIIRTWATAKVKGTPPSSVKATHGNQSQPSKDNQSVAAAVSSFPKLITNESALPSSKPSPLAVYMLYQIAIADGILKENASTLHKELLFYALKGNVCNIAELLVDKDVKLPWSKVRDLYREVLEERKENHQIRTPIADIIELPPESDDFLQKRDEAHKVGCDMIPYKIEGNCLLPCQPCKWSCFKMLQGNCCCGCCCFCFSCNENENCCCSCFPCNKNGNGNGSEEEECENSDLLLWAVLTDNTEMSEIFWKRSPEPIFTALVASVMLRRMSRKAHWLKESGFEESMKTHSRVFCQRAIDTTQKLYDHNPQDAITTLEMENEKDVWGIKESALDFALSNKMYTFVAHHVPQRSFNRIWKGGSILPCCKSSKSREKNCCGGTGTCYDYIPRGLKSPKVKFYSHYILFCAFLVCLSAFVMTNITNKFWPINRKSVYELCVYIWLGADIFEEYVPSTIAMCYRNLEQSDRKCTWQWVRRAWSHGSNFWNAVDLLAYVIFLIAICVRFGYEYKPGSEDDDFDISRRLYSIGLFIMYSKVLQILLMYRSTGPTVLMLKEGLKELLRFLVIMVVMIVSVGVFYHANLYPNHYDLFSTHGIQHWSFWRIIYLPYWSIYGEFKDEIEGKDSTDNCSNNETVYTKISGVERCPQRDFMVSIMSGFFILILNLLLVNLIIAMFSFRFSEIQDNADLYWRFHRSRVIMEYRDRTPVPLNIIFRLLELLTFICSKCCCKCCAGNNSGENSSQNVKRRLKQEIFARGWKSRKIGAADDPNDIH
ncbi:transient receptor potential cation channel subfamily M member 5-like [Argopecten irradians]|uniref:transient receptor potential cation channel subfamily M member 5-like n=1 Tax=Argopecten irradians TaxID=31199 RepID=UPI003719682B